MKEKLRAEVKKLENGQLEAKVRRMKTSTEKIRKLHPLWKEGPLRCLPKTNHLFSSSIKPPGSGSKGDKTGIRTLRITSKVHAKKYDLNRAFSLHPITVWIVREWISSFCPHLQRDLERMMRCSASGTFTKSIGPSVKRKPKEEMGEINPLASERYQKKCGHCHWSWSAGSPKSGAELQDAWVYEWSLAMEVRPDFRSPTQIPSLHWLRWVARSEGDLKYGFC